MKRRQPTAEELEKARQGARDARVAAGLPAEPPEDAEHERLQAERKRLAKKRKR
jgi:hypothetical protein